MLQGVFSGVSKFRFKGKIGDLSEVVRDRYKKFRLSKM